MRQVWPPVQVDKDRTSVYRLLKVDHLVVPDAFGDVQAEGESAVLIKGSRLPEADGRRPYSLEGREISVRHFVIRTTTPGNPFEPHKHEQPELWYVIEGRATVTLDSQEHLAEDGDLIVIDPWVEHGLYTQSLARWICLG
jgi:quercetin dioxygenase-like cupin family protein